MNDKKAWTYNFVYAYRGIAKHHCHIYEYKPTPSGMSINYYSSGLLEVLANFDKQE